ncbi:MAG TPA: sigma 54-interacting transcriptional regulator [Pyrinomonadaceae bacterium]|jgi:transcriptional regulator with GAF, ATPase, and Fis domain/tetratricopeptide (TPR) repeat protein
MKTEDPTNGVVDLADARLRLRSRSRTQVFSREALAGEIEEMRLLLDQGLSSQVNSQLTRLMQAVRHDDSLLAQARCLLSLALEMQGRYREALEAVQMYESTESLKKLEAETIVPLRVQLAISYNFNGDHPKAIALLNVIQREAAETAKDVELGAIYAALARVYRSIDEHTIARDYSQKALEHYRRTGDWRGLSETYLGLGNADTIEGNYEAALKNFEQALNLVGDRTAPHQLGKLYANIAGVCWFLKRPQEGIRHLETAISYYERTEYKGNAVLGYNNLGINLMLVGDWDRAQQALERALALASEIDKGNFKLPIILDSLGELCMMRGELAEAESYLTRAVELGTEHGSRWYSGQSVRTLGRCRLATNDAASALEYGTQALSLAERIGDRQALCESHLLLAEARLRLDQTEEALTHLREVTDQTTDSVTDLGFSGEAQRLYGMLALAQNDPALAAQHFGRSVSIFEMLGDLYRGARAHFELGRAYTSVHPERAAEHLGRAVHTFGKLGAKIDLARAEEALAALDQSTPEQRQERSAISQLLTLRLAEATASRELLLRELGAVLHQETGARLILIAEQDGSAEDTHPKTVVAHGGEDEETARLVDELCSAKSNAEREKLAHKHKAFITVLRGTNALPATLFIAPREASTLPGNISIEPLLRVVELGMDVCALRARTHAGSGTQQQNELTGPSLMPGFIHSSPAMTRLVEEVHKIRSSDVTVLVTGESGTGKELVARAIHALSSRRSKVFVPFNCTAVPKELSEGYLFGYRRGAFTGAVNDSAGVIRTAAGGTLFLDEIGDLPLDVQPKLLRFLQEGEIQPLGEQRPSKVDVRIIAATNTDLEEMVAQGKFREDLYYRLNVIRLRVPPLRERRSEIPTIVNYYINHYSDKFGRRDITVTPQSVDLLMVHDWPGNVRQLCNEIQRIVARSEDNTEITPEQLSPELKRISAPTAAQSSITPISAVAPSASSQHLTLADALAEVERRMIAEALRKHGGNISRAARELGLTRRGLYLKLERYEMSASA